MIDGPLVSIVINCYNGEKYLKETMQSIIDQTYKNWEIIFWDNQSNDSSAKIAQSFNDIRIKYFYAKSFLKLYEARNEAVKKINGEYLSFIDCDDYWHKNKIKLNIEEFNLNEIDIVYSKIKYIKHIWKIKIYKNQKYNYYPSGKDLLGYFLKHPSGLASLMIKVKSINKNTKMFNDKYEILADYDYVLNISKTKKFKGINLPLVYYRLHGNNLTTKSNLKQIDEQEKWINELKMSKDEIYLNSHFKYVLRNLEYIKTMNDVSKGNLKILLKSFKKHKHLYDRFKFIIAYIFRFRF